VSGVVCVLGACAAFKGTDTGNDLVEAGAEGGVDGGAKGGVEGGADASVADGTAPPSDGGAVARFCSAHDAALVCSDFDDPSPDASFSQGWDGLDLSLQNNAGGVSELGVAEDAFVSAPRSLRSHTVSPTTFSNGNGARLVHALQLGVHRVRVGLEVSLDDDTPAAAQATIMEIFWYGCGTQYGGEWLVIENASLSFFVDGVKAVSNVAPLTKGKFTHVVVDADWTSQLATVSVNDAVIVSGVKITAPCGMANTFRVTAGLAAISGNASTTAHLDNVVVDVDPP
jgi:hypothetical protein